MDKNGQKLWGDILSSIKSQISLSTYKTWFLGSFVIDYKQNQNGDSNMLIVGVKNSFLKEQVETRYLPLISEAKEKNGLSNLEVVFAVSQNEPGDAIKNEPLFTGKPQNLNVFSRKTEALNSNYTFSNFVAGSSNNLAYLATTQVAENLGRVYNPLLLYGPTGVGKTHLLHAIGNEALDKTIDIKVLYATAEKFTNDFIESLKNKTQQYFRQKYRNADVLLVDDIQFLAGKESTQDEFFHCFNELTLCGKQVVIACDRHPKELGRLKERLVSRFLGGMVADIGYPDFEMKIAILRTKCKEKEISLDDELISYIASESDGGARELEGVLTATLAQIKISNGQFNTDYIKTLLLKNKKNDKPAVTQGAIVRMVCKYFKVDEKALCSSSRKAALVKARQMLMYLLRSELGLSLEAIGDIVGGRDHSTVIHGIDKVEENISTIGSFRDEVLRVKSFINK